MGRLSLCPVEVIETRQQIPGRPFRHAFAGQRGRRRAEHVSQRMYFGLAARAHPPGTSRFNTDSRWHHAMAASIAAMVSIPKHPAQGAARHGFVIAMRARLTTTRSPPREEWIIVSRWGEAGEYLSIGRTKVPVVAGQDAPIDLTPHQTALALMLRLPFNSGPPTFLFVQRQPAALTVAGRFASAEGYVRLHGDDAMSRLRAEGRCLAGTFRSAWHLEAVRAAWIGEFVEGGSVAEM